jgi:2,4-dienoyl-CoA reductase-like NADH-dependent reductase (Old Yellow Enzyme family)
VNPLELAASPFRIRDLVLPNRFAMAPMTQKAADPDGTPNDVMVERYRSRAAGGTGLIITEGTLILHPSAGDDPKIPGLETDDHLDGWRRVVDAVHAEGGKIFPQLWHQGPRATGFDFPPDDPQPLIDAFVRCTRNALSCGFDGVEIHGAHGYLLDAYLTPKTNPGTPEERMRVPIAVARAVREAAGNAVVAYRWSQWAIDDYRQLKFHEPDDLALFLGELKAAGIDLIHVSTRHATDPGFAKVDPTKTLAGWTRELSGLPTMAVGGIGQTSSFVEWTDSPVEDPGPALDLLARGEADLLAIGRGLLANPDWADKVLSGRWRELEPYRK